MGFPNIMRRSRSQSMFGRGSSGYSDYPTSTPYINTSYVPAPDHSVYSSSYRSDYPTTPYGGSVPFPGMGMGMETGTELIPRARSRSRNRRASVSSQMFPAGVMEPYGVVPPGAASYGGRSRRNSFGGGGVLGVDTMYPDYTRARTHSQGYLGGEYYEERGRRRSRHSGYYGSDQEDDYHPYPISHGAGTYYSGGILKRRGFFNRRGDQLWDNDGSYKPAHPAEQFPHDLTHYPLAGFGWMDEEGRVIEKGTHRLVHPGTRRWNEIMGIGMGMSGMI